jgi:hypothetical protein
MRRFRLAVLFLSTLLVAQLAPAVAAAPVSEVEAIAVVDNDGPYASVTLFCRVNAPTGATATTVYCEAWDATTTSIQHLRLFPGSAGTCYFKSNQMMPPIGFCARFDAQLTDNTHEHGEDCHVSGGAEVPPQPPPTTSRTVAECVEPVPPPV